MIVSTLPNLSSHVATAEDITLVSTLSNPRPHSLTKESFRQWCAASTTQSKFFSVWQGINPKARIATGNPATRLHGIIGDYDNSSAASHIGDLPQACGELPTWIVNTFTPGKIRLIWEFETPINVTNVEITERFIRELNKRIRFSKALPGYDESSTDSNQYFELGTEWRRVEEAKPIPISLLEMAMIEAGTNAKLNRSDVEIPIEAVAAEVQRQFPGRFTKAFDIGARLPLFWINDGIDREGSIVTENGMVCFSDRAGSNFMPWRAILGTKFVQTYEEGVIGSTAAKFYTDGRNYYIKENGAWITLSREDTKLLLKVMGVSDTKRKGQNTSDCENVLAHILTKRRVAAAAPILYRDSDIEEVNGVKYLNLNSRYAMQPAAEGQGDPSLWPWLHGYINNAFDDGDRPEGEARDHFLAWLKHFYTSALRKSLQPGHILVIAGGVHTGKSFINRWLVGAAVGGSVNATPVLMRSSAFNKGAGEVGHWRVDDAPSDGDYREKRRFTQALKEFAANPTILWQPKFKDTIELPFLGRVCLTMNTDPESLSMLPAMDGSFADKVSLFLINDDFHPVFRKTNEENEAMLLAELPHFLRWLLDWEIPAHILNRSKPRFGVKPFHHAKLMEEAHAESFEYSLQEILEPWCIAKAKDKDAKTTYTATELLHELQNDMPGITRGLTTRMIGKSLAKLIGTYPRLEKKWLVHGITTYRFNFNIDMFGGVGLQNDEIAPF